jgi:hypothetical protein
LNRRPSPPLNGGFLFARGCGRIIRWSDCEILSHDWKIHQDWRRAPA